jgi:phosphate:Na+ symporter
MLRRILVPTILLILAYGFWVSPDFNEIAAGVAIFLFGMLSLEQGFKAFTGGILEKILRRTTDRLWKSLGFGIVTTTIMQSSSLVSVLTISFLSAGLIPLAAGVGIIFGANLGTTTGAWLVAGLGLKVKISAYAMPILVFGVVLVFQNSRSLKGLGYVLAGLGFLFLGIHYMKEGFDAFKDSIDLVSYAIPGFWGLLVFVMIGAFSTVIMQSSHATLVLIITALAAQQVTYENALALAIGANVGTTITAILGAMSSNIQGKRLAGAHLIFNLVTGLVAVVLIRYLMLAVDEISSMAGIAEGDYALKLAVFHTLFNLAGVLLMLPFVGQLVGFLESTLQGEMKKISEPRYLTDSALDVPDAAVESLRKEALHLLGNAFSLISDALNVPEKAVCGHEDLQQVLKEHNRIDLTDIDENYTDRIKPLYSAIVAFGSRAQINLVTDGGHLNRLHEIRLACQNIVEAVKDIKHLQKNLYRFTNSNNVDIHQAYDAIRLQLARLLREIDRCNLEGTDQNDASLLSLDAIRVEVERSDLLSSGVLDKLIRENRITAEMATSLMNDSAYVRHVANKLIDMARVLFSPRKSELSELEEELALQEHEIEAITAIGTIAPKERSSN